LQIAFKPKSIDHVHAAATALAELSSGLYMVVSVFDGQLEIAGD
jgi:hypothetical protein